MSAEIVWAVPAFDELDKLPRPTAFEIVARVEALTRFPEMGPPIKSRFPELSSCRELIVRRRYRVVYEFDGALSTVTILAVQRCRQKHPSTRDLRHRRDSTTD